MARILGFRNVLHGTVVDATPTQIGIALRGQPLPSPGSPVAFFVRPEDLRLLRKDVAPPDPRHHHNILAGTVVGDVDRGVAHTLHMCLNTFGPPAPTGYDL